MYPMGDDPVYTERRPIPDPTYLTQSAIDRGINTLSTLVDEKIEGSKRTIQAKIEGHWVLDEARFDSLEKQLVDAVQKRNELDEERFGAIALRFSERDIRFAQAASDHQSALTSALTSTNNAIARLESTFTKQFEALGARVDAQATAQAERITDLKDRVSAVEGERKGNTTSITTIISAMGVIVVIAGLLISHIFGTVTPSIH